MKGKSIWNIWTAIKWKRKFKNKYLNSPLPKMHSVLDWSSVLLVFHTGYQSLLCFKIFKNLSFFLPSKVIFKIWFRMTNTETRHVLCWVYWMWQLKLVKKPNLCNKAFKCMPLCRYSMPLHAQKRHGVNEENALVWINL